MFCQRSVSSAVCVTGETRAQTAEDNSLAASRRAG